MAIVLALLTILLGWAGQTLAADWNRDYIAVNYKGFPGSTQEIDADLELLGPRFGFIRTYNSLFGPGSPENAVAARVDVYNAAHPSTPMKVALGVALSPGDPTASQAELDLAIANAKAHPTAVNAVVVGNENLGNISESDLIGYINYAKTQLNGTGIDVTTCQTWGVVYGHPNLVAACTSYVLANIYPYWDGPGYSGGTPAQAGADALKHWKVQFLSDYNQLVALYGAGKIRIGETGWPSGGAQVLIDGHYTGIPSQTGALPNEQTYVEQYADWAPGQSIFTYLFSSFDEAWKTGEPGNVGPYWGIYTAGSQPKWTFGQLPSVSPGTTLWLGTDSPYGDLSFSGGTLLIIDPQTTWPNAFTTVAGSTSTLDTGGNHLTLTGALSGSGNLIQTGGGGVTLGGDGSAFAGTYSLNAGSLILANVLGAPCNVLVNPGGLLGGTGPLVGALTNNGRVNPGNSPGTLSIVGSYTQTAGGTYIAEIASAGSYDRISVTGAPGTASLNGAIAPTLLQGYHPPGNQVFPGVVTATGGVTGAFTTIVNQQISPTLFWQTRYNATSVDLWVQRHYTNPGLTLNSNQQQVGAMLDGVAGVTTGDVNTVLNAIDYLPDSAGVRNAYKQISPEKAGAFSTLGFALAANQMRNLSQRLTDLRFGAGQTAASLGSGSFNLTYSRTGGLMLAYNSANLAGVISAKQEAAPASPWGVYLQPNLILGSQATTANQTGFNFTAAGFTLGADYRLRDDLLVGLATGYSHTAATFRGSGGALTNNTWPITVYAAYLPQPFYVFGSLGYNLNLLNLERHLSFGGLSRTASGSTTGNQLNAYGEAGYDFKFKALVATPTLSLAYSQLWVNGYSESGADALSLGVGPQSAASLQTGVGAKVALPLKRNSTLMVPQFYTSYQHEFVNNSRGLDARLSQGGSTFTWHTDQPQRDFAVVGANCTISQGRLTIQLDYNAEVGRGNYTAHNINAAVRWQF